MVGQVGGAGASNVSSIMNYVDLTVGGGKKGEGKQLVPDAGNGTQGGAADMTPSGPTDAPPESASITLTLARIETSSGKASELFNKAMVTQIQEQKKNALDQQLEARQGAKDSLLAAAGQLQKEASDILSSAITNLVVSVVADAVSMVGTVAGGLLSAKGAFSENSAGSGIKNMSVATSLGKTLAGVGENAGKLGQSAGGFASAMGQYESKMDEGAGKVDEAQAQQYEAQADAAKQRTQDMQDFASKLVDFIHEIRQSKSEMMAAIVQKG